MIAVLPAVAIQAYNEFSLRTSRTAEVHEQALRLAESTAGELDRIVENGRGLLAALSTHTAVRSYDAAACSAYVTALKPGAARADGHPFCSSSGRDAALACVVTDYAMPRLSGADLARRVTELRPDLPVILLTGFAKLSDAVSARATLILRKPVSSQDLAAAVEQAVNGRRGNVVNLRPSRPA